MRTLFKPNLPGIAEQLFQPGIRTVLQAKAEAVASAAASRGIHVGTGRNRQPVPIRVVVEVGENRMRAAVILDHPAGIAVEARYGLLAGALAAAKG